MSWPVYVAGLIIALAVSVSAILEPSAFVLFPWSVVRWSGLLLALTGLFGLATGRKSGSKREKSVSE